jgi:hypothetical protein
MIKWWNILTLIGLWNFKYHLNGKQKTPFGVNQLSNKKFFTGIEGIRIIPPAGKPMNKKGAI